MNSLIEDKDFNIKIHIKELNSTLTLKAIMSLEFVGFDYEHDSGSSHDFCSGKTLDEMFKNFLTLIKEMNDQTEKETRRIDFFEQFDEPIKTMERCYNGIRSDEKFLKYTKTHNIPILFENEINKLLEQGIII